MPAGRLRALVAAPALAVLVVLAFLCSSAAARVVASPRPAITHLSVSGSGTSRTLNMSLSGRATVSVTVMRGLAGHAVRGRCQTSARNGRRCTLTVPVATHQYAGRRGRNNFDLQVARLAQGQYVAAVVAHNAGRTSTRHTVTFTIKTSQPVSITPPLGSHPVPAPPKPPHTPVLPPNFTNPTPTPTPTPTPPPIVTPPQAKTWGQAGKATTLVLYDSTGTWGWIGELNAMAAGNLASHFGKITAEPVVDYQAGQISQYTATIYIGSTYNEPLPTVFLNDVLGTTHPVVWAGQNIWQLSGKTNSSANSAFQTKYGWNPTSSFFDASDNPTTISYPWVPHDHAHRFWIGRIQTFTRNSLNGTGTMLQPDITNPAGVNVLAMANCSSQAPIPSSTGTVPPAANCASQAPGQSVGPTFPWAIRSSNLTYVVEDPFSYISETDRYVAFSNLLYDALDPTAPVSHQALVRLEDVSPVSNPTTLKTFADYLSSQNVPFSVNVIPVYTDPFGVNNADTPACVDSKGVAIPVGTPCTKTLADEPAFVAALKYIESKGGTLNDEGYTHQFSNLMNPYNGVTGDDAEFYRAQCSSTQNTLTPVTVTPTSPCPATDFVRWTGPVHNDSASLALARVNDATKQFKAAGLTPPSVWVTPHYFASVPDYQAIDSVFPMRYERESFPSGLITGNGRLNYAQTYGQFFPYVVHDVYGETVIPENLGDYEPTAQNGNAPRTEADIINEAKVNLAVKQSVASFFYDANDNPLANLQTIVAGIKALDYTFVSPTSASLPGG